MSNDYHIGVRSGLLEDKHLQALGMAVWLYVWLVLKQSGDDGRVLMGQSITYEMFAKDFASVSGSTFKKWLRVCIDEGYIRIKRKRNGRQIWILKSKKFNARKSGSGTSQIPEVPNSDQSKSGSGTSPSVLLNILNKRQEDTDFLINQKGKVMEDFQTNFKQPKDKKITRSELDRVRPIALLFNEFRGGDFTEPRHLNTLARLVRSEGLDQVRTVTVFALHREKKEFEVWVGNPMDLQDKWASVIELMKKPDEGKKMMDGFTF